MAHIVSESKIKPADIDEAPSPGELPVDYVHRVAKEKARTVWKQKEKEDNLVIANDTTVVLNQEIMDKPKNMAEAEVMLKKLSGETHTIYTAVVLEIKEREERILAEARVTFYSLIDKEINRYLGTENYADRAGAHGIQGAASVLVEEISGDYYSIVGFPIGAINQALRTFN